MCGKRLSGRSSERESLSSSHSLAWLSRRGDDAATGGASKENNEC